MNPESITLLSNCEIAIDVKAIIIWHDLNNKYDQLFSFYVKIDIEKLIVQCFLSYSHEKYCIFTSILLTTYNIYFITRFGAVSVSNLLVI